VTGLDTLNTKKEPEHHNTMKLPTKPNPRNYTITMKVTKDTYLEMLNEAERQAQSLSSVALQTFERGRGMGVSKMG
jgi:hypothetical protein